MEPSSPQQVLMGMKNTPSPSFSITLSIFGFLKSLDLHSEGLEPDMIPSVNSITGWELVVYDLVVAESKLGGDKTDSIGQSKDSNIENSVENLLFNDGVVEDAEDSDDDELILRFKRTVPTTSQTTTKPTLKCQRNTTTSPNVPLTAPLSRRRTQSSGPPIMSPLPEDGVESPVKKKKLARKSTKLASSKKLA